MDGEAWETLHRKLEYLESGVGPDGYDLDRDSSLDWVNDLIKILTAEKRRLQDMKRN